MTPRTLFIASVAIIAIATGTWLSFEVAKPPAEPVAATLLPGGNELPDFALLDQSGSAIDAGVFSGQWDLVFFGFTHCPDVCPLTLQVLSQARQQLAEQGLEPLPRIVLVSVDPERDTPEQLGQYIDYFGAGILGITGELDEIRKLTGGLGIWFSRSGEGDNYTVDHGAAVLVIDPDGQFRALFSAPHKVDNYVHDLPVIMGTQ